MSALRASLKISPLIISLFLAAMIFTSRLSLSIRSISLVISLLLIFLTIPPRVLLQTFCYHPVARAAALLFFCFALGTLYGEAPAHDRIHLLKLYSPLLWIGLLIAFFQTSFPQLSPKFSSQKTQTYTTIFVHGVVLVALLGCLNAWHIVNVSKLVHSSLTHDPHEYPFGTFSFSLSFGAYLALQKMKYATPSKIRILYLIYFIFLTFFIFFVNHERTAYILYGVLIAFFGYQHAGIKGIIGLVLFGLCVFFTASYTSHTFHDRSSLVVEEVKEYHKGNPRSSTGLRLFFIKASVELWKKKPLFGYGTGSFKTTYLTVDHALNMDAVDNTPESALDQPHNEYVHILVQLGLFGFAFFLWLLFEQTRQSFKLPLFEKQCVQALTLCVAVTALDTCLFFYATSMTDYFFFTALFFAPLIRTKPML